MTNKGGYLGTCFSLNTWSYKIGFTNFLKFVRQTSPKDRILGFNKILIKP